MIEFQIMSILLSIVEGLVIGILISAPMGPIGMLCIQRTIYTGRASGFFTGYHFCRAKSINTSSDR